MKQQKQCPYCKKEFKNLSVHLRFCKKKQIESIPEKAEIQQTPIIKEDLVIEFNEPEDKWQSELIDIFKRTGSGNSVTIRLRLQLGHIFEEKAEGYKYPSDQFINILRNYCSEYNEYIDAFNRQNFKCQVKK